MDIRTETTPFPFYAYNIYVYTRLTLLGFIVICGVLINAVAVYIITSKDKPLSTQNRLLLNLFLTNCTLCGLLLPVHMVDLSLGIGNDWGFFCELFGMLLNYGNCAAFMAYLHITLHRYFAVVFVGCKMKNIGYGSTMKTSLILGMCNLIPGILMMPGVIGVWGKFGIEPSHGTCNFIEAQNGGSATFNMFGQVTAIGIPLTTMVYCYGHIIYTVKLQKKKVRAAPISSVVPGQVQKLTSKINGHELRLTFASVVIIVLYMASFIPYLIIELFADLKFNVVANALSGPLVLSHAVTDPAIYFAFDRKLRGHVVELLKCPCKK